MHPIRSLILFLTLAACTAERNAVEVLSSDKAPAVIEKVFFGTTRASDGTGGFGFERSFDLSLGQAQISVPPDRRIGTVPYGPRHPNPQTEFALVAQTPTPSIAAFQDAVRANSVISETGEREVTLFVHGFNTSFPEALFRMAQMKHDLNLPGASVVYSWPSRAKPLGYEYDDDSLSFARDGLEDLLRTLASRGGSKVFLVAHSLGSELVMETLRQIEFRDPGWTDRSLDGVILFSPDIDIDVFRSQIRSLKLVPDPFIVFTSDTDRALELSSFLTGRTERLGNISDPSVIADLPVSIVDVSAFSEGGGLNHFIPASSPALIAMFNTSDGLDEAFLRGRSAATPAFLNAEHAQFANAAAYRLHRGER